MKTGKILFGVFVIVSAAQLAAPLKMIYNKEKVAGQGTEFKFLCRPVDPSDPFKGRYVALSFAAQTYTKKITDCGDNRSYNLPAYAIIGTDEKGFAKIMDVVLQKPADTMNYVKVHACQYVYDDKNIRVDIIFPFNEYYMNEEKAPLAEKAYWANRTKAYATVRVLDGTAVLTGLYIDGVPVEDYVKTHQN